MGERDFSVFQRKDGAWICSYKVGDKWKQHRLAGLVETKPQAERVALAWLSTQKAAGALGTDAPLRDLVPKWIALRRASPKVSPATIGDNASHMRTWWLPAFGDVPFDRVGAADVRRVVEKMIAEGKAPNTIGHVTATLATFQADAGDEGWIAKRESIVNNGIVAKAMPEIENVAGKDVIWMSVDAAQSLIECSGIDADRRVRYVLGFTTGLRDGELAGLVWTDVDLDAETPFLRVRKALALRQKAGKVASLADPKTATSKRVMPLHPAAVEALRWWLAEGWLLHVGRDPMPTDAILPNTKGKAWRPKSAEMLRVDLEAAKLPTDCDGHAFTFQASRRSFATWLSDAGIDEETRSRLMGHRLSSTVAKHYTAPVMRKLGEAVRTIPLSWPPLCAACAPAQKPAAKPCAPPPRRALRATSRAPLAPAAVRADSLEVRGKNEVLDMGAGSDMFASASAPDGHLSSVVEQRFRKPSQPAARKRNEDAGACDLRLVAARTNGAADNEATPEPSFAQRVHNGMEALRLRRALGEGDW
jgi:integrase